MSSESLSAAFLDSQFALRAQFVSQLLDHAQGLRQEGGDGDSYVPGKVSFPAGAGRAVQVSAGMRQILTAGCSHPLRPA